MVSLNRSASSTISAALLIRPRKSLNACSSDLWQEQASSSHAAVSKQFSLATVQVRPICTPCKGAIQALSYTLQHCFAGPSVYLASPSLFAKVTYGVMSVHQHTSFLQWLACRCVDTTYAALHQPYQLQIQSQHGHHGLTGVNLSLHQSIV